MSTLLMEFSLCSKVLISPIHDFLASTVLQMAMSQLLIFGDVQKNSCPFPISFFTPHQLLLIMLTDTSIKNDIFNRFPIQLVLSVFLLGMIIQKTIAKLDGKMFCNVRVTVLACIKIF